MTVLELQKLFLSSAGRRIAPEDFFILLAHATQKEKVFLLTHPEYSLDAENEFRIKDFLKRRLEHEPVASIIGFKEFYGYDFKVTKDTLIPRPETELVVELMLDEIKNQKMNATNQIAIIDVGTGSGNIIVSMVKEIERAYETSNIQYYASDISEEALVVAKENAKVHNVDQSITFFHDDLLAPYPPYIRQDHKIIIAANLPYLSEKNYQASGDDVKRFEPYDALVSDHEGLDHYQRLLREVKDIHTACLSVMLLLEISPEQPSLLQGFIQKLFPNAKTQIYKDLARKDRVVKISI